MSTNKLKTIVVAVVTSNREKKLRELLLLLNDIETHAEFYYKVLVVENDPYGRSRNTINSIQDQLSYQIETYHIDEYNLSKARNLCLEKADGDYLAFIDDDDRPHNDYLYTLFRTMSDYNADVVHGAMNVFTEGELINIKRRLLFVPFKTFEHGSEEYFVNGTGHSMFDLNKVRQTEIRFNESFSYSGAEDTLFFGLLRKANFNFAWSAEPRIDVNIPKEQTRTLKRIKKLLSLGIAAEKARVTLNNEKKGSWKGTISILNDLKHNAFAFPKKMIMTLRKPDYENDIFVDYFYHLGRLIYHFGISIDLYKKGDSESNATTA